MIKHGALENIYLYKHFVFKFPIYGLTNAFLAQCYHSCLGFSVGQSEEVIFDTGMQISVHSTCRAAPLPKREEFSFLIWAG